MTYPKPYARRRLTVSPAFVALVCGMIYLDPAGLALPFLLAAGLHEAGHLLAMAACGLRPTALRLGLTGAVIEAHFPSFSAELLVTLAGPAVNLLLALCTFRLWPPFYVINTLLLAYNLLPVYPLDGGRILRLLLVRSLPLQTAMCIADAIACSTVAVIVLLCLYASLFQNGGMLPLAIAAFFSCRIIMLVKHTKNC